MKIRIVNLRKYELNPGEMLVKIDRSSALGNPFVMTDEYDRGQVCDQYDSYFHRMIANDKGAEVAHTTEEFLIALRSLLELTKKYDIALGCWCTPQRCHAETIMRYLSNAQPEGANL